ncbi:unnamed protein product [Rotaria sp. Silwood2]|nr:unnamed protein product [Rotaria sp. Silwood2]CAF3128398.1 unnamed protein product [Rotaria sp. Silwood2]
MIYFCHENTSVLSALNQNPHGSSLEQQLLIRQTDETGQINYSLTIDQISLGSTEIEEKPTNGKKLIQILGRRLCLPAGITVYIRITRITLQNGTNGLTFLHPYPIWMNNDHAKVHGGSLFIPVTERDLENGYIKIENLAMLRLTQPDLAKIKTLAVYSPTQLTFTGKKKMLCCTDCIEWLNYI